MVDPDQTAPESGSTLFAILSASLGHKTVIKNHTVQI